MALSTEQQEFIDQVTVAFENFVTEATLAMEFDNDRNSQLSDMDAAQQTLGAANARVQELIASLGSFAYYDATPALVQLPRTAGKAGWCDWNLPRRADQS